MQTPQTVQGFKTLVKNMTHRERFVFPLKKGGNIEVYHTIKFESPKAPENICLTVIDENGNKETTINRLLNLWSDSYFQKIYDLLAPAKEV